jgi:hypothetical protein
LAEKVLAAVEGHQLSLAVIEDSVRCILRAIVKIGLYDRDNEPGKVASGGVDNAEKLRVAHDGMIKAAGTTAHFEDALGAATLGDVDQETLVKDPQALRRSAGALAKRSDVAVVVVGNSPKLESEGFDRPSMSLPREQDELIEAVAAA